ncbi:MAG: hypothetical protein EOO95_06085 [Pedobacter sp.]|nr:MAG: hypothetical protein EOO95_06085 [Pedobacter sp.]
MISADDQKAICFSEAIILKDRNQLQLLSLGKANFSLSVYPKGSLVFENTSEMKVQKDNFPTDDYTVSVPEVSPVLDKNLTAEDKVQVKLPVLEKGLNDIFLNIDYLGDVGLAYLDNTLVADDFYKGLPWNIGLKQFIGQSKSNELQFYFRPIYKTAPYLVDLLPQALPKFERDSKLVDIKKLIFVPEYTFTIKIK